MNLLRIATRKSPLALWQAEHVARLLKEAHSELDVELVALSTRGDEILDRSLAKIGGKGLFIKELEQALQEKRADIAVHSMKDVPADLPDGFTIAAVLERENFSDALVSNTYESLETLPAGAVVGTSSLRRAAQLLQFRSDFRIKPLRGNVGTRLGKLDAGEFDAIVLATAGLVRLGLETRIAEHIPAAISLSAIGQGAIGVECRETDSNSQSLLALLHCKSTAACVDAEREVNARLGGSCSSPIAANATLINGIITLCARVAAFDGSEMIEAIASGSHEEAAAIGRRAAHTLETLGAQRILELGND